MYKLSILSMLVCCTGLLYCIENSNPPLDKIRLTAPIQGNNIYLEAIISKDESAVMIVFDYSQGLVTAKDTLDIKQAELLSIALIAASNTITRKGEYIETTIGSFTIMLSDEFESKGFEDMQVKSRVVRLSGQKREGLGSMFSQQIVLSLTAEQALVLANKVASAVITASNINKSISIQDLFMDRKSTPK